MHPNAYAARVPAYAQSSGGDTDAVEVQIFRKPVLLVIDNRKAGCRCASAIVQHQAYA